MLSMVSVIWDKVKTTWKFPCIKKEEAKSLNTMINYSRKYEVLQYMCGPYGLYMRTVCIAGTFLIKMESEWKNNELQTTENTLEWFYNEGIICFKKDNLTNSQEVGMGFHPTVDERLL